jgi:hypothetical protein
VQPVGGAGEARLLGDGDEDGQLAKLHASRRLLIDEDDE